MKNLLAILAVAILGTMFAFAQSQQTVTVTVDCPYTSASIISGAYTAVTTNIPANSTWNYAIGTITWNVIGDASTATAPSVGTINAIPPSYPDAGMVYFSNDVATSAWATGYTPGCNANGTVTTVINAYAASNAVSGIHTCVFELVY